MTPPVDDDGRTLGWPMDDLLRRAIPATVKRHKWTPELAAFHLAESDEFAVEAAMTRGWCSDVEADRWALNVGRFPWEVWPEWLDHGLHPLDQLWPLAEWWRPAWLAAEASTVATRADVAALMRLTACRPDGSTAIVEAASFDDVLDAAALIAPHLPADAAWLEYDHPQPVHDPVEAEESPR